MMNGADSFEKSDGELSQPESPAEKLDIIECLLTDGAHILLSPLVPITGYGSYLQARLGSLDQEQVKEFIDTIVESSIEATDRIRMILLGLECRFGRHAFEDIAIDLHDDVLNPILKELTNQGLHDFSFKLESGDLALRGNRNLLQEAFRILLKFAYQTLQEKGPGLVRLETSEGQVFIRGELNFEDKELAECHSWLADARDTCLAHPSQALGLSVAGKIFETQHASFTIDLDNDLFTVSFRERFGQSEVQ